jgi:acyl carrier protein
MSEQNVVAEVDPKLVDEIEEIVKFTAEMICAEQPDVPEPQTLRDLDSFSMVQVLLELENKLEMRLLERMESFTGETFRDLADFIVRLAYEDEEVKGDAAATAEDRPTPA